MNQIFQKTALIFLVFGSLLWITGSAGCINNQLSDEWLDDQQDAYINDSFNASLEHFQSAGKEINFHYFHLYDLITDPEIADSQFMGREKGVYVTVAYNHTLDELQDTLWGHEVDATRIVQSLYSGEYGDSIGFVAVSFKFEETNENRITLRLDAADAEAFRLFWDDTSYIRSSDWSDCILPEGSLIEQYEEPQTYLRMKSSTLYRPLYRPETKDLPPYTKEVLNQQMVEITNELSARLEELQSAADRNDYRSMKKSSNDLILLSRDAYDKIESLPLTDDCEYARNVFLAGIEKYRLAGSLYWYGATFLNSEKIAEGNAYAEEGSASIVSAFDELDRSAIEPGMFPTPSTGMLIHALTIGDLYDYQDSREVNDISVGVIDFGLRKEYLLIQGEQSKIVTSNLGEKFLYINVEVFHKGFRGGGSSIIQAPDASAYSVVYRGEEIKHSTPVGKISNVGLTYQNVRLDRKEVFYGALVFIVPEDFKPNEAYIQIDLGKGGNPFWKLQ